MKIEISQKEIDDAYKRLKEDVESKGYFLNPNVEFTKNLIKGLLINEKRYGYWLCPCRLTLSSREKDLDVICPCYYRDDDLNEFGYCYCSLYVSEKNKEKNEFKPIPERRKKVSSSSDDEENSKDAAEAVNKLEGGKMENKNNKLPVWRCNVCGYLCARNSPPEKCPICGADADRFERFDMETR